MYHRHGCMVSMLLSLLDSLLDTVEETTPPDTAAHEAVYVDPLAW
jgi:hypothetical protein